MLVCEATMAHSNVIDIVNNITVIMCVWKATRIIKLKFCQSECLHLSLPLRTDPTFLWAKVKKIQNRWQNFKEGHFSVHLWKTSYCWLYSKCQSRLQTWLRFMSSMNQLREPYSSSLISSYAATVLQYTWISIISIHYLQIFVTLSVNIMRLTILIPCSILFIFITIPNELKYQAIYL